MPDLKSIPAVSIGDNGLSLHEVLHALHISGRLQPILQEVVTEYLTLQAAESYGLHVSDEELQAAADTFRASRGLNKAQTTKRWLQMNQLSQDDLESRLERSLLEDKLIQKLAKEGADNYFAENRAQFDQARIAHIVVADRNLADELKTQIEEDGQNFTELAQLHSIDKHSAGTNGLPVWVPRQRLPQNIAQAVFSAKLDDLVGPFQVGDSWHLIRVHNIRLGELNSQTRKIAGRQIFQLWLRDKILQTKVEVKLAEYF